MCRFLFLNTTLVSVEKTGLQAGLSECKASQASDGMVQEKDAADC